MPCIVLCALRANAPSGIPWTTFVISYGDPICENDDLHNTLQHCIPRIGTASSWSYLRICASGSTSCSAYEYEEAQSHGRARVHNARERPRRNDPWCRVLEMRETGGRRQRRCRPSSRGADSINLGPAFAEPSGLVFACVQGRLLHAFLLWLDTSSLLL